MKVRRILQWRSALLPPPLPEYWVQWIWLLINWIGIIKRALGVSMSNGGLLWLIENCPAVQPELFRLKSNRTILHEIITNQNSYSKLLTLDWLVSSPCLKHLKLSSCPHAVSILSDFRTLKKEIKCFRSKSYRQWRDCQSHIYTNIKLAKPLDTQLIVKMAVSKFTNGAFIILSSSWLCIKDNSKLTE